MRTPGGGTPASPNAFDRLGAGTRFRSQDRQKRAQEGARTPKNRLKRAPRPPKIGPRRPQDGQKGPQDGPRTALGADWPRHQKSTAFGFQLGPSQARFPIPFGNPFGVPFRSFWGPFFDRFLGCVLVASWGRLGDHLGGPGAARGDPKSVQKPSPKGERPGDEN